MIRTVAPAKINLSLEVLDRRSDGYHEVRTVMQTIDLHDELTFEAADDFGLEVKGPYTPGEDDLVMRAGSLFAVAQGVAGVHIRLEKRVPVAAGLGGGSSDGAATLRGMQALYGDSDKRIGELAKSLGSDVTFFLRGGTALAGGRGEIVTPLPDARQAWLVVVVPAARMENKTRTMYSILTPAEYSDGSRTAALGASLGSGEAVEDSLLGNVFERVAYETFAGLGNLRDWMLEAGARSVHVSGAGPALFAVASGEPEARAIRARMNRARRGERVYVVRTIGAAEATLVQLEADRPSLDPRTRDP